MVQLAAPFHDRHIAFEANLPAVHGIHEPEGFSLLRPAALNAKANGVVVHFKKASAGDSIDF